jgi:glycosyltransferase involved in cell wall biosynthesis
VESGPLVSIVTPFYNTLEFLGACIESVLRQTYQNWEYVLVDNCSDDGSGELAATYVARAPGKLRIVKTASFLSQVENYNFALSCIATDSKYCKVVQADDWIFPECVRSMVELAEAHPAVGIVAAYELEGNKVTLDGLPYPSGETAGRDIGRLYFLERYYLFGTPTSLLMRSDMVRSRQPFYDARYAPFEDADACFDLLKQWHFGFVHQVLTFSRRDNESILSKIRLFGFNRLAHLQKVVLHGRDYLTEDEFAHYLKKAERAYSMDLGKAVFHGRGEKFWKFHRDHLAVLGYALDGWFFAKWVPLALLEYVGNPKSTLDYFWSQRGKAARAVIAFSRQVLRIVTRGGFSTLR